MTWKPGLMVHWLTAIVVQTDLPSQSHGELARNSVVQNQVYIVQQIHRKNLVSHMEFVRKHRKFDKSSVVEAVVIVLSQGG